MRTIILTLIALITTISARAIEIKDIPNVQLADSTQFVSDPFNLLTPSTKRQLNAALRQLREKTTAEVAVVMIDALPENTDIDTYTTNLFEKWGIGQKDIDNGLLMLVSRDDRQVTIRTGQGIEPILPDMTCGRIIRNRIVPAFKTGSFDAGVTAGLSDIIRILTDPDNINYIKSGTRIRNTSQKGKFTDSIFNIMVLITAGLMLWIIYLIYTTRNDDTITRYTRLDAATLPAWCVTALTLGLGLIPTLILMYAKRKTRSRHPDCPNCGHKMEKKNEETDNDYLTPAQDTEEKLNSVDYDVWVCPECNETDILPFRNKHTRYTPCPTCHARACMLTSDRILRTPTPHTQGHGIKTYKCQNCAHTYSQSYTIAKTAPPVIIVPGGGYGRGGDSNFGGFGGGGFGGGNSMGGGATGGW